MWAWDPIQLECWVNAHSTASPAAHSCWRSPPRSLPAAMGLVWTRQWPVLFPFPATPAASSHPFSFSTGTACRTHFCKVSHQSGIVDRWFDGGRHRAADPFFLLAPVAEPDPNHLLFHGELLCYQGYLLWTGLGVLLRNDRRLKKAPKNCNSQQSAAAGKAEDKDGVGSKLGKGENLLKAKGKYLGERLGFVNQKAPLIQHQVSWNQWGNITVPGPVIA